MVNGGEGSEGVGGGSSWSLLIFFNGTLLWIAGSPHRTSLRLPEQMCKQPTELYWWRMQNSFSRHLMCSGSTEMLLCLITGCNLPFTVMHLAQIGVVCRSIPKSGY